MFFSNLAAETEKTKSRVVEVFYKKIAFFPQISYKNKFLFSLSFGQKWKKIRKWKKVPFFHFPHKAWGGGLLWDTLYVLKKTQKLFVEKLFPTNLIVLMVNYRKHKYYLVFTTTTHNSFLQHFTKFFNIFWFNVFIINIISNVVM